MDKTSFTLAADVEMLPRQTQKELPKDSPFLRVFVVDGKVRTLKWLRKRLVHLGKSRKATKLKEWTPTALKKIILKRHSLPRQQSKEWDKLRTVIYEDNIKARIRPKQLVTPVIDLVGAESSEDQPLPMLREEGEEEDEDPMEVEEEESSSSESSEDFDD